MNMLKQNKCYKKHLFHTYLPTAEAPKTRSARTQIAQPDAAGVLSVRTQSSVSAVKP